MHRLELQQQSRLPILLLRAQLHLRLAQLLQSWLHVNYFHWLHEMGQWTFLQMELPIRLWSAIHLFRLLRPFFLFIYCIVISFLSDLILISYSVLRQDNNFLRFSKESHELQKYQYLLLLCYKFQKFIICWLNLLDMTCSPFIQFNKRIFCYKIQL